MYTSSRLQMTNGRVMRHVRFYNRRGICTSSKMVPLRYSDKDWSTIPLKDQSSVAVSVNRGKPNARGMIESYLRGADIPATVGDIQVTTIRATAKRDWLIAMGFVTPNGTMERELEWVPGDRVYAEHDTETEEEYCSEDATWYDVPMRRKVECAEDCTEDESLVIMGGYFKVV